MEAAALRQPEAGKSGLGATIGNPEIAADDLLFVDHAGRVHTKEMDLAAHRSGLLCVSTLAFSDTQTRSAEPATIVVTPASVAGSYEGAPFSGEFRYTRVW